LNNFNDTLNFFFFVCLFVCFCFLFARYFSFAKNVKIRHKENVQELDSNNARYGMLKYQSFFTFNSSHDIYNEGGSTFFLRGFKSLDCSAFPMYLIAAKGGENEQDPFLPGGCLLIIQRFVMLFLPNFSPRNFFSLVHSALILRFPKKF